MPCKACPRVLADPKLFYFEGCSFFRGRGISWLMLSVKTSLLVEDFKAGGSQSPFSVSWLLEAK